MFVDPSYPIGLPDRDEVICEIQQGMSKPCATREVEKAWYSQFRADERVLPPFE